MSSGGLLQIAHGLYEISERPRETWRSWAQHAEEARLVGSIVAKLPLAAIGLAIEAQGIARQMPHSHPDTETELRGVCRGLSNALLIELKAAGVDVLAPWWNRS